jgi:hypothetical protein
LKKGQTAVSDWLLRREKILRCNMSDVLHARRFTPPERLKSSLKLPSTLWLAAKVIPGEAFSVFSGPQNYSWINLKRAKKCAQIPSPS